MARKENCAFMSISFAQSDDETLDWCRADSGTGRALLASLTNISYKSGVPALAHSPLVVVGVCAAGQFAYHLAAFAPTRVASFVTIGGGKHDLSKFKGTISIPALLIATPDRGLVPVQNLLSLYAEGKQFSAPWEMASEPIARYDAGMCSSRVTSYLSQRLVDLGHLSHPVVDSSSNSTLWLPISIRGVRLPMEVSILPSVQSLGTLNPSTGVQTLSFAIQAAPNAVVDTLSTISSNEALQASLSKKGPRQWQLECLVDSTKLPLGPSNNTVKVRFSAQGKQLLGGAQAFVSGFVTGPLSWQPHSLNFGFLKPGQIVIAFLTLSSRNKAPVKIEEVASPYPWIKVTDQITQRGTIVKCMVCLPINDCKEGFAGYLRLKLLMPAHRSLKILCFGSVDSKRKT
jgi:hypothetical protein